MAKLQRALPSNAQNLATSREFGVWRVGSKRPHLCRPTKHLPITRRKMGRQRRPSLPEKNGTQALPATASRIWRRAGVFQRNQGSRFLRCWVKVLGFAGG